MSIREHLRAVNKKVEFKVAVVLTIIGFFVTNVVTFLGFRVHDLEATIAAETLAHEEALRQKDVDVKALLPLTLDAPLLTYPDNNASLLGRYVQLEWQEGKDQSPARSYTVELIKSVPTHLGLSILKLIHATDPEHMSSTLRLDDPIAGSYLWRVRRGSPDEKNTSWSTYFRFEIYPSSMARIKQTKELRVGTFIPARSGMIPCPSNPSMLEATNFRFDDIVLDEICDKLAKALGFEHIRFGRFSSADALVYQGVKDGNVDLAVSSLSETSGRIRRGVLFSTPYLSNHLVVARIKGESTTLDDFARVGVVRGGTNSQFAHELQRHRLITVVEAGSIEELLRLLQGKEISVIIIDEPLINYQLNHTHELEVIQHLSTGVGGLMNFFALGSVVTDARADLGIAVHERELKSHIDELVTNDLQRRIRSTVELK